MAFSTIIVFRKLLLLLSMQLFNLNKKQEARLTSDFVNSSDTRVRDVRLKVALSVARLHC